MPPEQSHVTFQYRNHVLTYLGLETDISARECDLLLALIQFQQRGGEYASKAKTADRIYCPGKETKTKTVDVILFRMKQQIAKVGIPFGIDTIHGVGIRRPVTPIELDPPVEAPREFVLPAYALPPLRELLKRCSDRPADAALSERVRGASPGRRDGGCSMSATSTKLRHDWRYGRVKPDNRLRVCMVCDARQATGNPPMKWPRTSRICPGSPQPRPELPAFVLALIRDLNATEARANFRVINGGAGPADEAAAFQRLGRQLATAPTSEGFAWVTRLLRLSAPHERLSTRVEEPPEVSA
jgi:hypothetical protein